MVLSCRSCTLTFLSIAPITGTSKNLLPMKRTKRTLKITEPALFDPDPVTKKLKVHHPTSAGGESPSAAARAQAEADRLIAAQADLVAQLQAKQAEADRLRILEEDQRKEDELKRIAKEKEDAEAAAAMEAAASDERMHIENLNRVAKEKAEARRRYGEAIQN